MNLNPHINFKGDCEAAFKFYEQHLGGKIKFMLTYGASPMAKDVAPEWQSKVVHAAWNVDGGIITGADNPPSHYQAPQGFSLTLEVKDAAEAERVFLAFAENGKVQMPLQETFWATRFGRLVDRFGIPWMVNCPKTSQHAA